MNMEFVIDFEAVKVHNIIQTHRVFCRIDNIMWNIPHIKIECEEYSTNNWQSHIPLLWV
jgi:hypothetical protein